MALLDISGVDCSCATHALESLHKSMAEGPDDGLWRPHESPLLRWLVERVTETGLQHIEQLRQALGGWLGQAQGRGRYPGALAPWTTVEREAVRSYLYSLPAHRWKADDYALLIDSLFQEYLPASFAQGQAQWMVQRAALAGRVQASAQKISTGVARELLQAIEAAGQWDAALRSARLGESIVDYARARAAENIVALTDRGRHAIHSMVLEYQSRASQGDAAMPPLEQSLRDKFGAMNRDWRRIAVTEVGETANQGLIASLAPGARVRRMERYRGVCAFCAKWNGRIFDVVAADAPDKDGQTQVWPGKTNVGRSASPYMRAGGALVKRSPEEMWWPAAGLFHPNCRGRWVRMPDSAPVLAQPPGEFDDFLSNFLTQQRARWAQEQNP